MNRVVFLSACLFLSAVLCAAGPVSYYGALQTKSSILMGKTSNTLAQVRGVSFGWSCTTWESARFFTADAVDHMVDDWKAEIVRAPLGQGTNYACYSYQTAEDSAAGEFNYRADNEALVEAVVDAAIAKDVYVIIDWHSHQAEKETELAKDYFSRMAQKYGAYPHVIFELYNEPLTDWATIKAYAEAVIPVIREHSSNLILVGTPSYSQKVEQAAADPISDPNLAYVLHFYADTHTLDTWKDNINATLGQGIPLFVTEYGTTNADGGDPKEGNYETHNAGKSDEWMEFMDKKYISNVAWNVNDKKEGSAFFGVGKKLDMTDPSSWSNTANMTASGQYIFAKLNKYYETAKWKDPTPILGGVEAPLPQGRALYFDVRGNKLEGVPQAPGVYVARQGGVSRSVVVK
jgi:endoglucanase